MTLDLSEKALEVVTVVFADPRLAVIVVLADTIYFVKLLIRVAVARLTMTAWVQSTLGSAIRVRRTTH